MKALRGSSKRLEFLIMQALSSLSYFLKQDSKLPEAGATLMLGHEHFS
jgi:hypothetical protein